MERIKRLLNDRIFLTILVVILTVGIVKGVLALIYIKDQPKFIPEEVREDIRGTIKENIAQPLEKKVPAIGRPFVRAAYVDQTRQPVLSGGANTDTANWKTYKNEEYGFSLKYPEEWSVVNIKGETYLGTSDEINSAALKSGNGEDAYWKGLVNLSVIKNQVLSNYISESFDSTGVAIEEKNIIDKKIIKVVDNGPNRFGGGTGFYYYFQNKSDLVEIGLDYFMKDKVDDDKVEMLNEIVNSINTF